MLEQEEFTVDFKSVSAFDLITAEEEREKKKKKLGVFLKHRPAYGKKST